MEGKEETAQARDVAVRADTVPDGPVRVDTAMRRCATMYLGPMEADNPRGRLWWRKVALLAARH